MSASGFWFYPGSDYPGEILCRGQLYATTPGQNATLKCDQGHNITLNCVPEPGSQLIMESWLDVKIQRGIKTRVTIQRGLLTCLHYFYPWNCDLSSFKGSRDISTWTIYWILSKPCWIMTPQIEIQWGPNSILHRHQPSITLKDSFLRSCSVCGLRSASIFVTETGFLDLKSCLKKRFDRCCCIRSSLSISLLVYGSQIMSAYSN